MNERLPPDDAVPASDRRGKQYNYLEMDCLSFGLSDIGRVRRTNEDDFLIAELTNVIRVHQARLPQPPTQSGDTRAHLFVVADGMGGNQAGEVASVLAVESVQDYLLEVFRALGCRRQPEAHEILGDLEAALLHAHARVCDEASSKEDFRGMGTTLTLAYVLSNRLFVAHAGDSRCYLLRAGRLAQLTRDHTLVGELVREGQLQPDDILTHRMRHIVYNVVGGAEFHADLQELDLAGGDVLLLCSDGLTGMLSDADIAAVLRRECNPETACEHLVSLANVCGGRDNITVVVARFTSNAQLALINPAAAESSLQEDKYQGATLAPAAP